MNGQVKVTWRTLRTIAHSLMVNARFLEAYIHFTLMYTTIRDLINKDGDPTTPFKLATGTKPLLSHSSVSVFPCVVQKSTAHVGKKELNTYHQAQKGFRGILVGISQHQNEYIVYISCIRKIISSYDVVFRDIFSSTLTYLSQLYAEAMDMRLDV